MSLRLMNGRFLEHFDSSESSDSLESAPGSNDTRSELDQHEQVRENPDRTSAAQTLISEDAIGKMMVAPGSRGKGNESRETLSRYNTPEPFPPDQLESTFPDEENHNEKSVENSRNSTPDQGQTPDIQFRAYPSPSQILPGNGNVIKADLDEHRGNEIDFIKTKPSRRWIPTPLRFYFWGPFTAVTIIAAIGLEVALHFSNRMHGWPTKHGIFSNDSGFMHYVYTVVPVFAALFIASLWAWTDVEIKKMQPYVDLLRGKSPPSRSLLLDYTRRSNISVWYYAAANRHYLVSLASLLTLLSLTLQPLAAALLVVRDTPRTDSDIPLRALAAIGLNLNADYQDLSIFLSAAGFVVASILYTLDVPPFVHNDYTIVPFELPVGVSNGTVSANTVAVKSNSSCEPALGLEYTLNDNGTGWTISATSTHDCTVSWIVDKSAATEFGTSLPTCHDSAPPEYSTIAFWLFNDEPEPGAVVSFCSPSISLVEVSVVVDIASHNITAVSELGPFITGSSNFSQYSGNVTGPPLNGRAYNGLQFNLTSPDPPITARQSSIQTLIPASILQVAENTPDGVAGAFQANVFADYSQQVYMTYLTLVAKSLYFLPVSLPLSGQVQTIEQRLWLSAFAVHFLTAILLILALLGSTIHLFHRASRQNLHLAHRPGTIASAVSISGQTGLDILLAGRQGSHDILEALHDKRFRIDPETMKIVMEGENDYDNSDSAGLSHRRSIFSFTKSKA